MDQKKPFKETRVGKFLQSKGFTKALDIAGTAFSPLSALSVVKDLVMGDNPEAELTPEEKQEFMQLYQLELTELDLILKDVQSARDREVRINESEKSSWLAKNIVPIIAYTYILFSMALNILVLVGKIKTGDNITFQIVTGVTNITMLIIGYYFGSSRTSSEKDGTIKKLMGKA